MDVADSLLDLVGNTPLVRLGRIGRARECDLLAELVAGWSDAPIRP